jgi:hypothetical protein
MAELVSGPAEQAIDEAYGKAVQKAFHDFVAERDQNGFVAAETNFEAELIKLNEVRRHALTIAEREENAEPVAVEQ